MVPQPCVAQSTCDFFCHRNLRNLLEAGISAKHHKKVLNTLTNERVCAPPLIGRTIVR